jgi:hypothetical protein
VNLPQPMNYKKNEIDMDKKIKTKNKNTTMLHSSKNFQQITSNDWMTWA